jgi:hypothetical protein
MTNNNPCIPAAVTPEVTNPCEYLPKLRAAMYALMAGQAKYEIRLGDNWASYQRGDAQALQVEVRRLELLCEQGHHGRAIQVGAPFRHNHFGSRRLS